MVIPAFGQGMFETEAITTLMGFIRQFREMERARRPLFAYRLTGKVKLQDHSLPLPSRCAARISGAPVRGPDPMRNEVTDTSLSSNQVPNRGMKCRNTRERPTRNGNEVFQSMAIAGRESSDCGRLPTRPAEALPRTSSRCREPPFQDGVWPRPGSDRAGWSG